MMAAYLRFKLLQHSLNVNWADAALTKQVLQSFVSILLIGKRHDKFREDVLFKDSLLGICMTQTG